MSIRFHIPALLPYFAAHAQTKLRCVRGVLPDTDEGALRLDVQKEQRFALGPASQVVCLPRSTAWPLQQAEPTELAVSPYA